MMKSTLLYLLAASLGLFVLASTASAHHSVGASFDTSKPIVLKGVMEQAVWANPHAHIFMDAKDSNGKMANWEFELGGIKKLQSLGWKKDSIKMGDQVTIEGWQARNGSNRANANTVTKAGGQKMTAGSSYNEHPKEKHTGN